MLKVNVQELSGIAVLCLKGQVVVGELNSLREAVQSVTNVKVVVLDMSRVTTIDAGGLGLLLQLREWTSSRNISLKLIDVSEHVRQMLQITHLDSVFPVRSSGGFHFLAAAGQATGRPAFAQCARS